MGTERLHKALAHAGVASRRAAEELIRAGRVRVNGALVDQVGAQVDPERDRLEVDGRPVELAAPPHAYVLLHKPVGVVTTAADPQGRPTVLDLVRSRRRLYPVGRLDADSEGLVLLTDDGELTYRLTQARYGVEKEYHALVRCAVRAEHLRALRDGVLLDDGPARAVRADVLRRAPGGTWLRVVLHEGRKREVRRMLAAVDCPVQRLLRERVGPLALGRLGPGEHRPLTRGEVATLRTAVGLESDPARRIASRAVGRVSARPEPVEGRRTTPTAPSSASARGSTALTMSGGGAPTRGRGRPAARARVDRP